MRYSEATNIRPIFGMSSRNSPINLLDAFNNSGLGKAALTNPKIFAKARNLAGYLAFWVMVFIINAGPHWEKYSTAREQLETVGLITGLQYLVAAMMLKVLAPRYLNQSESQPQSVGWFLLWVFVVVIIASEINILVRYLYLERLYPESYRVFLNNFGHMDLAERMSLTWSMRYIIFSKVPVFLLPAVLLLTVNFYTKQGQILRLKEQKRTAELDALKNQLNPHFIFNTLNNIYALALKKSDQTPEAIEKLSAILDYVVYRCDNKFVSLQDEVALIQNYVALEKLRYGKRLEISINTKCQDGELIAPLILLTLVENACKHGTSEELNKAFISLNIESDANALRISVANSKPSIGDGRISDELQLKDELRQTDEQQKVGLLNLTKQLDLLYAKKYQFEIVDEPTKYLANLTIFKGSTPIL